MNRVLCFFLYVTSVVACYFRIFVSSVCVYSKLKVVFLKDCDYIFTDFRHRQRC